MPAKSAAQQKAAGAALSAKRGDTPKSKLQGASKSMEKSMSEKQLEELAHTKRKGKPGTPPRVERGVRQPLGAAQVKLRSSSGLPLPR